MACECGGSCSCGENRESKQWALTQALLFVNMHVVANQTQNHLDFSKVDHDFVIGIAKDFYDFVEGKYNEVQDKSEQ